ncbi:ATP-dependent DNA helicase [Geotalea sp. SG265]|uniref:ATP-dependent DNA helicase n=1 Tax=Geotalea sp. SG265 TaxID=2922867 RepID=UPI001FAFAFC0|nr:ATP-dependent DNA helicase [Geotalea sp. SG265]
MDAAQKLITVPLRDFALPVPIRGSIEALSGYGRAAAEGQEIHQKVQKKRAKTDPSYRAEVAISACFQREGYCFKVDGRMDGLFKTDPPHIEEIKSTFNLADLARRLENQPFDHPYCLQLLCYGYFYRLQHGVTPHLSFHLVSSRSSASLDIPQQLDIPLYEQWLEARLDELVSEARLAEKRAARRRKVAAGFAFPFPVPRPGQDALMETIEQGMRAGKRMLIQAPTGLGKTVGVLYPVLKEALKRGQKVVYITPKNSQHSLAEDAVRRFHDKGSPLKSLSITAKSKICFKDEPLCNPDYCQYARDYYTKLHENGIRDLLARRRKLKARIFRELGEHYQVCPFELQLEGMAEADVVICDYNYVFGPRSALGSITTAAIGQSGKANLVIDEAHNLPSRTMDYYSPSLSAAVLERMRPEISQMAPRFRREGEDLLDGCLGIVAGCGRGSKRAAVIAPPVEAFLEQDVRLRGLLTRYLESDAEIQPRDIMLRLSFYWSEFANGLAYAADPDQPEFFVTWQPGGMVRITCCDASRLINRCYEDYQQVVAFSATLKPFEYYAALSGLEIDKTLTAEFPSPFPAERRKLLFIPQVSTRYSRRERNYAKIAEAIVRIVSLRRGNYFVFFPSFDFLQRTAALFHPPAGFSLILQERNIKAHQMETILETLRNGDEATVVFAVQGGSLAEGMDYAGDIAIGAFVVGPPLPTFDLEREEMRHYYERRYGAGFDYAYVIPAMAKAVQAAGRVIRSETDQGLIVLMDDRFAETSYSRAMPADWFRTSVMELTSGSILRDVEAFWLGGDADNALAAENLRSSDG